MTYHHYYSTSSLLIDIPSHRNGSFLDLQSRASSYHLISSAKWLFSAQSLRCFFAIIFYRDLRDLAPKKKRLYTETPLCNSDVLNMVRSGKVNWLCGDNVHFEERGITYTTNSDDTPSLKRESFVEADTVIMATGYDRPSLDFLPANACSKPYEAPNWYLQTFPVGYPTLCAINATWVHGIGTVGGSHIGIYTTILLMFLVDRRTQPDYHQMRAWVDRVSWWKSRSPAGPLDFVTWGELQCWFMVFILSNPYRWSWLLFLLFGLGRALPIRSSH